MARINKKINMNSSVTIRTFTVATIEMLEKAFGEKWGHPKKIEDMDEDELAAYAEFLEIRERIFDLGNDLIHSKAFDISYSDEQGNKRRKIYGK